MKTTMNIYRELDPELEHRMQFTFKSKCEHIVKVNISNIGYPSQHIDVEIPAGSRDQVIVPNTLNITFNREVESSDKTRSVVKSAQEHDDEKVAASFLTALLVYFLWW